ncbi:MAG: hypothetical protein JXB49_09595 [Bacteroidales bacterium]|nr:hypothetical protein [Bacteroidales bacterium]
MKMIRKLTIYVLVILFNVDSILPQDYSEKNDRSYHLIYLDISRTKERKDLTDKLISLINEVRISRDDFLVYLSNGYKPVILSSQEIQNNQIENLTSILQTLNTSSPMLMFDKDTILNIWDRNDIISVNDLGKIELRYKSVYFHFFISSELFKVQEDELIDKFLLIKNLTKKHIDANRIIIDLLFSRNDSESFLERKNQLARNNWTGYNYSFTQY